MAQGPNRDPVRPKQGPKDTRNQSIVSIVYFPQFMGCNLHRLISYTRLLLSIEIGNISFLRLQLDRISGLLFKVVYSSTLVLDKAPICTNDTLSPSQNGQNTPPKMVLNLMLIAPLKQFLLISPQQGWVCCKPSNFLVQADFQLKQGLRTGREESALENAPDS